MYISMIQLESHSEEQTQQFSISLAKVVNGSCCIALEGTLGSGKTSFVQGLGRGLSVNEPVISPTFAIVHEHQGDVDLLHADLYRLEEQDLINLGLEEAFETFDGLVVVEWANLYPELLPLDHLYICIGIVGEYRRITVTATGTSSTRVLEAWKKELQL